MNRRERRARNEPDSPVESKIVSVDRVDPADVGDAFHPHGGPQAEIADHRYVSKLEGALESEKWVAFRAVYRTYIPRTWRWDHDLPGGGSESTQHITLKVLAAEFLDRCGHDFSRLDNLFYDGTSAYNREWVYDPSRFEVNYDAGIADVACDCDDCSTYVEVGRVSAKKWYSASQYRGTDTFIVIPYLEATDLGWRGTERYVYLFHRLEPPEGPTPIHPDGL